ncbi:penicillin-binding protein 1B [Vibrio sp. MA40-2]|uniref:penicillin-binding protein 1B n=1 Tax=Vibrio sp. MA40-2 TaxID=3391828 RepID=UPI0039A71AAB
MIKTRSNATKKTPVKRKSPAKKSTTKKKTTTKTKVKQSNNKKGWFKVIWSFGWKLSVTLVAVLVFVGIYFDSIVKEKFEGQVFDLPTVVYARVLNLSPGMELSLQEMLQELDVLAYRKVQNPKHVGEYSASSTKIELIRRPFDFEDGPEPDRHVMLHFDNLGLKRIESLEKKGDLGFLRIEPKMLGMLEKQVSETRLYLKRNQFPEFLVDALLATEDRNFYQHDGVSPTSILRALVANIKAGRTVQGGSTLTQQLAKNLFLSREKTIWRKIREAYIALILDYRYDKDKILEAYLNEVYLGQSVGQAVHGFGLASRLYFGAPVQELRYDQLALLVGMVKGPSYYNPIKNPQRARERRDLVLRLMMRQEYLTASQYDQAVSRDLDIQDNPRIARRQPAYFQQLANELKQKVGDKFNTLAGLTLFTTLDPVSQTMLEQAVQKKIPELEKYSGKGLEAAAIAVDRKTGEIRAMVGGKRIGYDGFNRALNASRQIGSLVKPAVYLTALSDPEHYNLATSLTDKPITLKGSKGSVWQPKNFDNKFRGDVPLYQAMAKSINIPTVRLGLELGIDKVTDTLEALGVDRQEIRPVPSMFLGSFSLTPFQVAQMYQTLTNSGQRASLTALRVVKDNDDNIYYQSMPKKQRTVDQQAAWLTTYAMKKAISEGTGRYLHTKYSWAALAGKTGTSNDSRDSWFVGVDGREVVTLWVGRDDNKPTKLTGSSGALRVYSDYLSSRIPQRLTLPWPKDMVTIGFKQQKNGQYELDCDNKYKLPIWDKNHTLKDSCASMTPWFKKLFN